MRAPRVIMHFCRERDRDEVIQTEVIGIGYGKTREEATAAAFRAIREEDPEITEKDAD